MVFILLVTAIFILIIIQSYPFFLKYKDYFLYSVLYTSSQGMLCSMLYINVVGLVIHTIQIKLCTHDMSD